MEFKLESKSVIVIDMVESVCEYLNGVEKKCFDNKENVEVGNYFREFCDDRLVSEIYRMMRNKRGE